MPNKTLEELVVDTNRAVGALKVLLEHQRKAARHRLMLTLFVAIPAAMLISGLVTITTVSVCFLGTNPHHPSACRVIPKYSDSQNYNKKIIREFRHLIFITNRNDHRLDQLENSQ